MQKPKMIIALFLLLFPTLLFAQIPTYTESETQITVDRTHPTFIIKLKSNPTTGYDWSVNYNKKLIKLIQYSYQSPYNPTQKMQMVGTPGYGIWIFKQVPQRSGAHTHIEKTQIKFSYQRRWEKVPVNTLVFTLMVYPSSSASSKNDDR